MTRRGTSEACSQLLSPGPQLSPCPHQGAHARCRAPRGRVSALHVMLPTPPGNLSGPTRSTSTADSPANIFFPLHTCSRVCLPCRAASPRCGRGCTASKRSGGATTRTHGVGHTPGCRPRALGSVMLAGVAMLHWFCTSALSTCGSVLLCSIVYYPRDGFYVFSVQCGLRSVQIKYCSIYGGQEQHWRACCEA